MEKQGAPQGSMNQPGHEQHNQRQQSQEQRDIAKAVGKGRNKEIPAKWMKNSSKARAKVGVKILPAFREIHRYALI